MYRELAPSVWGLYTTRQDALAPWRRAAPQIRDRAILYNSYITS
jgi:hypothetical protein